MAVLSGFAPPFYLGAPTLSSVPDQYQVAIKGHGFIIEPKEYRRSFLTQQRTDFLDTSDEPGENSLNPLGAWRRSVSDWSHGAGQTYLDSDESDRLRFRESKGLDPWTPHQLQLLPATLRRKASVSASARVEMVSGIDTTRGVYLLDSDGTTERVWYSADPTATSPTWTQCTGLTGPFWDIATDGANVYVVGGVAGTTKIYSRAMGGTAFSELTAAASTYVGVAYANGRLFAWKSTGAIVEIASGGTETAIFTHRFGSAFTWVAVIGAPNATYLLGSIGNNTEIYQLAVKDATGALSAPVLALAIIGEAVTSACFEGSLVILGLSVDGGTGGNARLCQVGSAGSLTMGPLILTASTPEPIRCVDAAGRFVYFGWSNYDSASTGLGRLDLSTFTSLLVPAYASDVMAGRTGAVVQGDVTSTAVYGTVRLFTVAGKGIWAEGDATGGYTQTGVLSSGRVRYGLLDFKSFSSVDSRLDALPANTELTVTVTFDDGSAATGLTTTTTGFTGHDSPVSLPRAVHEWCEVTITISAPATTAAGSGPVFRWWVLRAVPTTGAVEQITLPIILRTSVPTNAAQDAVTETFDVQAELDFLRGLVSSREIVTYQEGESVQDVYVSNLEQRPDVWARDNRNFEGLVFVEIRSLA